MKMNESGVRYFHFYTFLIMLYYFFAPMEDLLTGRIGTVAKFIAILILFFGMYCTGGEITIEYNTVNKCLIYLMVLSLVSCVWATDLPTAFNRNVAYLLVPGLALFVGQLEFSAQEREVIVTAAIAGGLVTVIYLFMSGAINIYDMKRLNLVEGNDQNNFAALMFLPLGLCVGRIANQRITKKIMYVIFIMLFLYIILLTGSRGALLAVLMFICVLVLFSKKNNKLRTIIGVVVLFLFTYYAVLPMLPEHIRNRLFNNDSYLNTMSSKENRKAFWTLAFTKIIPQNLPFGVGSGCTPIWLGHYFSRNRAMHNTFINMLCEYGFFGLPAFLCMLWSLFKEKREQGEIIELALLAGMCLIIFFLDSYQKKFFWNVIMLLLIGNQAKNN